MPRRTPGTTTSQAAATSEISTDALQVLKDDHYKVSHLFEQFAKAAAGKRREVANHIFKELEVHSALEEELFYPALENQGDLDEMAALDQSDGVLDRDDPLDQAEVVEEQDDDVDEDGDDEEAEPTSDILAGTYEDHQVIKELIQGIKGLDSDTSDFLQGMMELQDMFAEHAAEEEEVLFAEARRKLDTRTLGIQMQRRKQELLSMAV